MTLDGNEFIKLVRTTLANHLAVGEDSVTIVWCVKVLQNNKCLVYVNSDGLREHYFEVTYNGNKGELYIDTYIKVGNKKQLVFKPSQEE